MWEQEKLAMVESAKEVCGSVKVRGKNPKSVWWTDEIKAAVRRKKELWEDYGRNERRRKEEYGEDQKEVWKEDKGYGGYFKIKIILMKTKCT